MSISLCMIVKNEEQILSRCLESTKDLFDEIIVVDTGSDDNTKKIASNYTNQVYDFDWINDFSKARNYAFSKATSDYIMWLDADDIISKKDQALFLELKKSIDGSIDIYLCPYNIAFDESGNTTFSYFRERIIKNDKTHNWNDKVHEYISLIGKLSYEKASVTHKSNKTEISFRNLNIYRDMEKKQDELTPRNLYYYSRELYDHQEYAEALSKLKMFLQTKMGWKEDNINACIMCYNCSRKINNQQDNVEYLYQSFLYDKPRKKVACLIGDHYFEYKNYDLALYWYNCALLLEVKKDQAFYETDYDFFLPYMGLCLTYDKLKDFRKAYIYHKKAKKIKPKNKSIIYNDQYFKDKINLLKN